MITQKRRRLFLAVAVLALLGPGCISISSATRAALTEEVSGGGCPPNSSVTLTSADGRRLGSATADARGAFRRQVDLPPGTDPKHPLISVACGSTVVAVSLTLVDADRESTPLGVVGVLAGAIIVAAVAVTVLRRRATATSRAAEETSDTSTDSELTVGGQR